MIDYVPFTAMQNATGQPAINLPLHWNKAGLPIGTQFVGRFGDEVTLLETRRRNWKRRSPGPTATRRSSSDRMSFAEYDRYDGLGLAELIADRKISAREVVDEAIARAENTQSHAQRHRLRRL